MAGNDSRNSCEGSVMDSHGVDTRSVTVSGHQDSLHVWLTAVASPEVAEVASSQVDSSAKVQVVLSKDSSAGGAGTALAMGCGSFDCCSASASSEDKPAVAPRSDSSSPQSQSSALDNSRENLDKPAGIPSDDVQQLELNQETPSVV